MNYFDGLVFAVADDQKDAYVDYAKKVAALLKQHGALRVVEGWGNDVPEGKLTSFPMAVKLAEGETAVMSWIEWPSKEVRDTGMAACMKDPLFDPEVTSVPFDGKRMIFAGFDVILDA
ncbi:DUF1428 domain-containing protein [Acanthopleuribacter pedis]|uniref:DUF1428 domain-containing protein n=1 Tax=Acanthopleuribacter pedis TaxID=442870 RepID=A0A8J7U6V8_9BACT|nr:DUF1428 domain-containing protein [Acanthopleuribacter pedis]MBO1323177.1 DUF1428 domain-containing protein [Acanthopleuribacter pedis]